MKTNSLLLIEDDDQFRDLLADVFVLKGFAVAAFANAEAALAQFHQSLNAAQPFTLILSDIDLPGMSGIDLLRAIRSYNNQTPFMLMSGRVSEERVPPDLIYEGFFEKPFRVSAILRLITKFESVA